jgi:AraC-like DNA-binding protein
MGDLTSPLLAQAAGDYRERAPASALRLHFSCVWRNRITSRSTPRLTIPPDGCIDLQWVDGTLRIAGPDREPNVEYLPSGSTVLGLRFQAGSAARWLRIPASEIVGQRLPLEMFWGIEARHIGDWVSEASTLRGKARRLELAMAQRAAGVEDGVDGVAREIFELVVANGEPGGEVLDLLSRRMGMSERTARRKCHVAFGYGPKTLDRILRLQRFLRASKGEAAPLASLAGETGYSDQAHLSRETRRLTGLTPSAILAQLAR